jgi:Zn-dependent protease
MIITIFSLIVLLFSVVIHEVAHGSVAYYLGDPTAKYAKRLTLNPIRHLDLFGSIILPGLMLLVTLGKGPVLGWAKPVPINPNNLKDRRWGELKVSLAGPATNILVAVVFALPIRFFSLPDSLFLFFSIISIYNFLLAIFNLIPIPPLDGSHILFSLLPFKYSRFKISLTQYGVFVLIFFIFFGGINWVFYASEMLYYIVSGQTALL